MSDFIKRQISKIFFSHEAICQREIMLDPFWPNYDREKPAAALGRLAQLWRARVLELKELGCPQFGSQDSLRFEFALNCPPSSVQLVPPGKPCQIRVCPFCWARKHAKIFSELRERLFPDEIAAVSGWRIERRHTVKPTSRSWGGAVGYFAAERPKKLIAMLREAGVVEAWALAKVFPLEETAGVEGQAFGLAPDENAELNLADLRRTVSQSFSYPTALLQAPAAGVMAVLQATHHRRLLGHWPLAKRKEPDHGLD
jgi:hypothetical protein